MHIKNLDHLGGKICIKKSVFRMRRRLQGGPWLWCPVPFRPCPTPVTPEERKGAPYLWFRIPSTDREGSPIIIRAGGGPPD